MATTFAIASLAIAMSTGMAEAHWTGKRHMHIPGCSMGRPAGCDMRLRYGGRSPSDNVSEGAMVPPEPSLHDIKLRCSVILT